MIRALLVFSSLLALPLSVNAAYVNVVSNDTIFNDWHSGTFTGALGSVNNVEVRTTTDAFANEARTPLIVANSAKRFDLDYDQLYGYISTGGRFVLYTDYEGNSSYPEQTTFANEILTALGTGWSVGGSSGYFDTTSDINTDNPFAAGVSAVSYAASGQAFGVLDDDIIVRGLQGQVLSAGIAIGDGYLFLNTDMGVRDHALLKNMLTVNNANVPVPAAVWLFGSGLGLLGWAGRTRRR
jgi:hypothetical protein